MGKDSMVFYTSWLLAVRNLPREIQGEVLTAILEFGLLGETTESLKPIAATILELVKPQIEINQKRWENSLKGGRKPSKTTEEKPNENQTETKLKPNENQTETYNVYVYDNVNVNDNKNIHRGGMGENKSPNAHTQVKRFTPPTLEQVAEYCKERKNDVNPNSFINFYSSNGWKVGKNPMKDWKAAVRTWENNGISNGNNSTSARVENNPVANQQWRDPQRAKEWDFTSGSDFD